MFVRENSGELQGVVDFAVVPESHVTKFILEAIGNSPENLSTVNGRGGEQVPHTEVTRRFVMPDRRDPPRNRADELSSEDERKWCRFARPNEQPSEVLRVQRFVALHPQDHAAEKLGYLWRDVELLKSVDDEIFGIGDRRNLLSFEREEEKLFEVRTRAERKFGELALGVR